jgi:ABC-2 type transport system permease protein
MSGKAGVAEPRLNPLWALVWARHRIARHNLRGLRRESRLKVVFVVTGTVLLWLGIFLLSRLGFGLFEVFGSELLGVGKLRLGDIIMARLLSVFALTLFVLLVFSNVVVAYQTFYRAREVAYLVQSPLPMKSLFLGRFYECISMSSWASAFLGSPVLLAYGLECGAPLVFYLSLVLFFLPFVAIPAALGTMTTMLLVRFLAGRRRGPWFAFGGFSALLLLAYFRRKFALPNLADSADMQGLVDTMGHTQSPFLPSFWVSRGLLSAAVGDVGESLLYLLLLTACALLLGWLATLLAERVFYEGWSTLLFGEEGSRSVPPGHGILGRLEGLLAFLGEPTRSLVIKDIRLFWRDPAQWSQFVLFFGIMTLYVANLRQPVAMQGMWGAWGTLLNLGASMLVLASLTTRFVFPLISLEGRRFWILGLAPVTRRRLVWQKFWLSVVTTAVFTVGLALLSAIRLHLDATAFILSLAGVMATTIALSGLAVGLGSLYPNFQEDNPARVVSGMGGTLNFILSMVYVVLILTAQALVLLWARIEPYLGRQAFSWIVLGVALWILLLTALTCLLPMYLGLKHLESAEL